MLSAKHFQSMVCIAVLGILCMGLTGCSLFSTQSETPMEKPVNVTAPKTVSPKKAPPAVVTFGHLRRIGFENNKAYQAALDALHYRACRMGMTIEDLSGKDREILYNLMDSKGNSDGLISFEEAMASRTEQKDFFLSEERKMRDQEPSPLFEQFAEEDIIHR